MRFAAYTGMIIALAIVLAFCAGCTTPESPGTVPSAPAVTAQATVPTSTIAATRTVTATTAGGIETTVNVHFNDYACLDIQEELGVDYLYPDQKITIWATSPGSGTANVNVLFLDVTDNMRLRQTKPSWDIVKKIWVYEGIVPMIQFNDLTTPQEKTITIKNQGKYYLCVDDRKETGTSDAYYQVPVRITRT